MLSANEISPANVKLKCPDTATHFLFKSAAFEGKKQNSGAMELIACLKAREPLNHIIKATYINFKDLNLVLHEYFGSHAYNIYF